MQTLGTYIDCRDENESKLFHCQGSTKQDDISTEAEIEEKEMETSKDDDPSEKPSSEVCKFEPLFSFIVFEPGSYLMVERY